MVQSLQRSNPFRIAFDSPELLEVQRFGFNNFLKEGIPNEFSKMSPIKIEKGNVTIELILDGENFQLISPDENPRDCILKMKTYSCKLYVEAILIWKSIWGDILYQTKPEWVLLGHLPLMTKRGHFIINGSPRVIVHQVVRSPGIYFQEIIEARQKLKKSKKSKSLLYKNTKKRIRFYGDIIPRRGVWLRLQLTHKGRIEAKLKKGKKISAQALQRCLEIIEKEESSLLSSLTSLSGEVSTHFRKGRSTEKTFPVKNNLLAGEEKKNGLHLRHIPIDSRRLPHLVWASKLAHTKSSPSELFPGGALPGRGGVGFRYAKVSVEATRRMKGRYFAFGKIFCLGKKWTCSKLSRDLPPGPEGREVSVRSTESTVVDKFYFHPPVKKNLQPRKRNIEGKEVRNTRPGGIDKLCLSTVRRWFVFDKKIEYHLKGYASSGGALQLHVPEAIKHSLFSARSIPSLWSNNRLTPKIFQMDQYVSSLQTRELPYKKGYQIFKKEFFKNDKKYGEHTFGPGTGMYTRNTKSQVNRVTHNLNTHFTKQTENLSQADLNMGEQSSYSGGAKLPPEYPIQSYWFLQKRERNEECIPEDKAFSDIYDKLYRTAEDKEEEQWANKRKNRAFVKTVPADQTFKRKKCSKNLFETFKVGSRYDLSDLGREKINTKLGISVDVNQLTSSDINAASNWLHKLRKGEKSIDDIDHSQNRRIRTSGELLQTQFENGIDRLKKIAWNKLKELATLQSGSSSPLDVHRPPDENHNTAIPDSERVLTSAKKSTQNQLQDISDFSLPFNINEKDNAKDVRSKLFFSEPLPKKFTTPAPTETGVTLLGRVLEGRVFGVDKESLSSVRMPLRGWVGSGSDSLNPPILYRALSTSPKKMNPYFLHRLNKRNSYRGGLDKNFLNIYKEENGKYTATQVNKEREEIKQFLKEGGISIKELLNPKAINGALREFFGSNPLSQYMDQTNPLAEITHKRRISSLGVGGVSRESAGMAIRGIHPTHYGRICPIETPEGKNAGLVNSLAFYAKIDDKGFIKTPYYKVVKGQVQEELGFAFFSAKEEGASTLHIAPSDLQQSWNNVLTANSVPVRVADNLLDLFKKINLNQVDCIGISPIQMISVATSLIPFLEHNDANRALMGSNMQRQAVPLMIPERPVVGTGLESLVVAESGHLIQSKLTGFVSYVSGKKIVVEQLSSFPEQNLVYKKSIGLRVKQYENTPLLPLTRRVSKSSSKGRELTFGKPSSSPRTVDKLCLSTPTGSAPTGSAPTGEVVRHVRHGFGEDKLSFFGRRFLSESLSKSNINLPMTRGKGYKSTKYEWGKRVLSEIRSRREFNKVLLRDWPRWDYTFQSTCVDDGTRNLSSTPFGGGCLGRECLGRTLMEDSFIGKPGFIQKRKQINKGSPTELLPFIHTLKNFDRSNQDTCLTERALVTEGDWVQKGDILTDCSASDRGELAVGKNIYIAYTPWEGYNFEDAIVISERLLREDIFTSIHIERYDFNAQHLKEKSEWFTNDLPGIPSQSVSHLDEFGLPKIGSFVKEGDILVGKIQYSNKKPTTPYERLLCDILGEKNFSARDASLYVPKGVNARVIKHTVIGSFDPQLHQKSVKSGSPKVVHIFLGEKRRIQVGDKMSGRHGNKGVIATILPRQDMPYLADGTPIDILLNPLGVPSRMNVGQVFECLLGLAGTYLAQHFKITPFDELYGVEASQSLIYLKLYQARLQSGQNWLFQVDFPGKTRLIDGRSGESFDQWVTVGKAYMLKLIHMVNDKIHARETGPYALVTQQPLRGRAHQGGQRLGEMEVWALEAFGAAYTLQELLTKKSDDVHGRKEIAPAILPRPVTVLDVIEVSSRVEENKLILGHPEIFKVLICELQALCLDVGVYSLQPEAFQRIFLSKVE